MPVVMQVMNTSYNIQSKNEIVKEAFLFCSFEDFGFSGFIKHNKLKFTARLNLKMFCECLAVERDLMQIVRIEALLLFYSG